MNAAIEKMFYLGALRSRVGRTTTGAADLVIVRRGARGPEQLAASEETELLPSDVVEVALRLDFGDSPTNIPSASAVDRPSATRQAQQEPTSVPR